MGCFNMKGCISNINIREGDEIVLFLAVCKPTNYKLYPCSIVTPISLPIYGRYDDYGGITNYKNDSNVKWIKKHLGDIKDVVDAFCPSGMDLPTIKECIESNNKFHPDESIRYVYHNLLKLSDIKESDRPCIVMEHKSLYKKWNIKPKNSTFLKCVETHTKYGTDMLSFKLDLLISGLNLHANSDFKIPLALYVDNPNFLIKNKDEVCKLENFICWLLFNGKCFDIAPGGSQNTYYEEDIEYHKDCIKLLKKAIKVIKRNQEEYEDE